MFCSSHAQLTLVIFPGCCAWRCRIDADAGVGTERLRGLGPRSKLVNCAQPGTIDERVINDKKGTMSRFEISENIQLALHSARGVGVKARRGQNPKP